MRIGLDARFLTNPQHGGFKSYTTNLILALADIDTTNEYILYVDRTPSRELLADHPNFSMHAVRSWPPLVGMPIREQVSLPLHARHDRLDVMHFMCNTAPVFLPPRSIITLHDSIQVDALHTLIATKRLPMNKSNLVQSYSSIAILLSARRTDMIITGSEYERRNLSQRLSLPPNKIRVIPLAPSPQFIQSQSASLHCIHNRYANSHDQIVVGVGYEPRKNIPVLIKAFAICARTRHNARLVIVASHEASRQAFMQLTAKLGISERVDIRGGISSTALAELYRSAKVFVFPSEREGFGLPPLEAMACGTPVIAARSSSLPEVLGDAAIFVESRSVAELAVALGQVLDDAELRQDLAVRGVRHVQQYCWRRTARETLAVYEEVAGKTRAVLVD